MHSSFYQLECDQRHKRFLAPPKFYVVSISLIFGKYWRLRWAKFKKHIAAGSGEKNLCYKSNMWVIPIIFAPFVWLAILIVELKPYYHFIVPIALFILLWKPVTLRGIRVLGVFLVLVPSGITSFLFRLIPARAAPRFILYLRALSEWIYSVTLDLVNNVPATSVFGLRPLYSATYYRRPNFDARTGSRSGNKENYQQQNRQPGSESDSKDGSDRGYFQGNGTSSFDPWTILETSRGSSRSQIIAAYKAKIAKNHPDKVANLDSEFQKLAHERAILLKKALDEALQHA